MLGRTLHKLGRLFEAEALETRVVELKKGVMGGKHADIIAVMENLASALFAHRRYERSAYWRPGVVTVLQSFRMLISSFNLKSSRLEGQRLVGRRIRMKELG